MAAKENRHGIRAQIIVQRSGENQNTVEWCCDRKHVQSKTARSCGAARVRVLVNATIKDDTVIGVGYELREVRPQGVYLVAI